MPTINYILRAGAIIRAETSSAPALELTLQKQMELLQRVVLIRAQRFQEQKFGQKTRKI